MGISHHSQTPPHHHNEIITQVMVYVYHDGGAVRYMTKELGEGWWMAIMGKSPQNYTRK